MNVTVFPWQNGLAEAEIETLTGRLGFTTIVIELDVAGLFEIHDMMEEVSVQVTTSLLMGV